jgi:hypothetical protein
MLDHATGSEEIELTRARGGSANLDGGERRVIEADDGAARSGRFVRGVANRQPGDMLKR